MVRPNHDLPNVLVGGIKDFADREEMATEVAHAKLLREALVRHNIRVDDSGDCLGGGDG